MTVPLSTYRNEYLGDGALDTFPYTFAIIEDSHLAVYVNGALQTLTTHYTVTGAGTSSGGNVVFGASYIPAVSVNVIIMRSVPVTQETDYVNGDPLDEETLENDFDKMVMLIQQLQEVYDRCPKFTQGSLFKNILFPELSASKFLQVNAAGTALQLSAGTPYAAPTFLDGSAFSALWYDSSSFASINAAVTAIGATEAVLVVSTAETLVANLVIPANIHLLIQKGGSITKAATYTLTFNSAPSIGPFQVFIGFSAGNVTFALGTVAVVLPEWWGTGVTAVALAAASLGTNAGIVFLMPGSKNFSGVTFASHRQGILGSGENVSILVFTGSGAAISFDNGASAIVNPFLGNFTLDGTANTSVKYGIQVVDQEDMKIRDFVLSNWSDATKSCEGIRSKGKHKLRLDGVTLNTDLPVHLMANPYEVAISADHYYFENIYFTGDATHHAIEADTGLIMSNITIGGSVAIAVCKGLFRWVDTTSAVASSHFHFGQVRVEQETDATAYMIDIQTKTGLYGFKAEDIYGGLTGRGIKLRNVINPVVERFVYINGSANEAINLDATVFGFTSKNSFWQAGTTADLTGQRLLWSVPKYPATGAIAPTAYYDSTTNTDLTIVSDVALGGTVISLADTAKAKLCDENFIGMVVISSDDGASGIYQIKGPNAHAVAEAVDPGAVFSVTEGTASSYNVYWDAGNARYELENNAGGARTFRVCMLGRCI